MSGAGHGEQEKIIGGGSDAGAGGPRSCGGGENRPLMVFVFLNRSNQTLRRVPRRQDCDDDDDDDDGGCGQYCISVSVVRVRCCSDYYSERRRRRRRRRRDHFSVPSHSSNTEYGMLAVLSDDPGFLCAVIIVNILKIKKPLACLCIKSKRYVPPPFAAGSAPSAARPRPETSGARGIRPQRAPGPRPEPPPANRSAGLTSRLRLGIGYRDGEYLGYFFLNFSICVHD